MTNTHVTLTAADGAGTFDVYTVGNPSAPVVLVIQEIFGITDGLKAQCQQYADLGYYAVCPDLFWRQQAHVSLTDTNPNDVQQAFALFNGFNVTHGLADIFTTLQHFNAPSAVVGYCLGGMLAYLTAAQAAHAPQLKAAVAYYAVGLESIVTNPLVPTLMHFAQHDEYCPTSIRQEVEQRLSDQPQVTTVLYPHVQHAFARINGINYNAEAALLANQRTKDFLQQHLPVAR